MPPVIFASYKGWFLDHAVFMDVIEKHNKIPLDLSNTDCKNNGNDGNAVCEKTNQLILPIKFLAPEKYQEGLSII